MVGALQPQGSDSPILDHLEMGMVPPTVTWPAWGRSRPPPCCG